METWEWWLCEKKAELSTNEKETASDNTEQTKQNEVTLISLLFKANELSIGIPSQQAIFFTLRLYCGSVNENIYMN